ncbi:MAG: hypothetical protein ABI461_04635 [Polyangiaceae bacterium]
MKGSSCEESTGSACYGGTIFTCTCDGTNWTCTITSGGLNGSPCDTLDANARDASDATIDASDAQNDAADGDAS